jgi:hypothetical protein
MTARTRLSWNDVRLLTPRLFLHEASSKPPMVARRLWAAITVANLNFYQSDFERVGVMSLLLTESLIFQEFQKAIGLDRTMLCPQSAANYLGIQPSHIAALLDGNNIGPTTGEDLDDVLTLDLVNRDCVAHAIMDHIGGRDDVFRMMAFPYGLTRDQLRMSLNDLLIDFDNRCFNKGLLLCRNGAPPNWDAGFAFIDGGFERTYSYTEPRRQ